MTTQHYYEEKVPLYSISGSRKKHILDLLVGAHGRVLDIGCGSGELAKALVQRGFSVDGADISQEALQNAGESLSEGYCFDVESAAWPTELMQKKYDVVIATEVIEHVFNTEAFLKNIQQLLSENGFAIITTPNVLFWKNRLKIFFGKFEYENKGIMDHGHIRFFTRETLLKAVEKAGYAVVQEHNVLPNFEKRKLSAIGRVFPGLFSYQLVLKIRKR